MVSKEGSGVESLLEQLVWPAVVAEANFRNICMLSTYRTPIPMVDAYPPTRIPYVSGNKVYGQDRL